MNEFYNEKKERKSYAGKRDAKVWYYIDLDPELGKFQVIEKEPEGKIIDFIKSGFNDTKTIISKRKDDISKIYTNYDEVVDVCDTFNNYLENNMIRIIKCIDCGRYFYMTEDEIAWYDEKRYDLPTRDKLCRIKRKNAMADKKKGKRK